MACIFHNMAYVFCDVQIRHSKDAEFEKICSKSRCLLPVRWAACGALFFFRDLYKYSLLLSVLSNSGINSAKSADEFFKK